MLTRILFVSRFFYFILLVSSFTNYSQYSTPPQVTGLPGDWSITFNAGLGLSTLGKTGHKISFETAYRETSTHEFVFSFAATKLPEKTFIRSSLLEFSIGPRLYPLKNGSFFVEAAIGAQLNNTQREYYDWYGEGFYYHTSDTRAAFLISVAAGVKLPITENNAMLLRLGYNTTHPYEEGVSYFSTQFGLCFNNSTDPAFKDKSNSKFAVSAGGGYVNPADGTGYHYSGSGLYILEGIFLISPMDEIYLNGSLVRLSTDEYTKSKNQFGITVGPRFFINRSVLSSFVEFGGGVYLAEKNEFRDSDPLQPGINIGTGFTGRMTTALAMYLKGNLNYYFTDNPLFPAFSSITGGLRFNL